MGSNGPSPRALVASLALVTVAGFALLSPSCASWDGHLDLLGYTTRPNYDTRYRTVRVPVCKNYTPWVVTPSPGMEMDLTRAIIREIQQKTPYRICQDNADTELFVRIVNFQKAVINYSQFNEQRDIDTVLTVELFWRDLHTGEILTRPSRRYGEGIDADARQPVLATADSIFPPGSKPPAVADVPVVPKPDDENPIDPVTREKARPIKMTSLASYKPELGESLTTSMQRNIDRMAVQIVSAMEKGW